MAKIDNHVFVGLVQAALGLYTSIDSDLDKGDTYSDETVLRSVELKERLIEFENALDIALADGGTNDGSH